jgi:hypothetical protein
MIKFLNVQSAFEHYNRMLRGNVPVETRAGYQGDTADLKGAKALLDELTEPAIAAAGE